VQAIGEAAGISRGSIFWHFGSKEGLLWAVAEQAFTRWEREGLVPDVGDATGLEAVRRALDSHRRFLVEQTDALQLFYVLMFEALGPRPELAHEFARLHRDLRTLSVPWLQAGIAAGEIRPDVDANATVTAIIGALGGIAYQYLLDPEALNLVEIYADLEATLTRGLAA